MLVGRHAHVAPEGADAAPVADRRRGPAGPTRMVAVVPLVDGRRGDVRHRRTGCPSLRPGDEADGRPSRARPPSWRTRCSGPTSGRRRSSSAATMREKRSRATLLALRRSRPEAADAARRCRWWAGRRRTPGIRRRRPGRRRAAGRPAGVCRSRRVRRPPAPTPGRSTRGRRPAGRPASGPVPTTATWRGPAARASATARAQPANRGFCGGDRADRVDRCRRGVEVAGRPGEGAVRQQALRPGTSSRTARRCRRALAGG